MLHFVRVVSHCVQLASVTIQPIDWIRDTLCEVVHTLVHDDVDRLFNSDGLIDPFFIVLLHLQCDRLIAEIFSKRDFNDVTRQNIRELRGHVNVKILFRIAIDTFLPFSKRFD